jgi:hypothetical protein
MLRCRSAAADFGRGGGGAAGATDLPAFGDPPPPPGPVPLPLRVRRLQSDQAGGDRAHLAHSPSPGSAGNGGGNPELHLLDRMTDHLI